MRHKARTQPGYCAQLSPLLSQTTPLHNARRSTHLDNLCFVRYTPVDVRLCCVCGVQRKQSEGVLCVCVALQ